MRFVACSTLLVGLIFGPNLPALAVQEAKLTGKWEISYILSGSELPLAVVEVETKDGKTTGKLLDTRIKGVQFNSVQVVDGRVEMVLSSGTLKLVVEGRFQGDKGDKVFGTFVANRNLFPATMVKTEKSEIKPPVSIGNPLLKEVLPLRQKISQLNIKVQNSKDKDVRAELRKEILALNNTMTQETFRIYRQALDKGYNGPALFEAVTFLCRSAEKNASKDKISEEEVKSWIKKGIGAAELYGSRWQSKMQIDLVTALGGSKSFAGLVLDQARQLEKSLSNKDSDDRQIEVLTQVSRVLETLDRGAELKAIRTRIDRLDSKLDKEYLSKMPPFKGTPFAGRKAKSDRAVVMELFTGAQCPPCVAADVAFDVLGDTYKSSELILIQYHVHIPGPDPLTCPESVDRYEYYTSAFPMEIGGTPSVLFNGKKTSRGGGPLEAAQKKYGQYREIIDDLVESQPDAQIQLQATRKGEKIEIGAEVKELDQKIAAEGKTKLRIILVEETVRYVGTNRLRFHHHVVRAMPGGAQGILLTGKQDKYSTTIDLAEVRKGLHRYLDDYAANQRPFPHVDRPMELAKLRLIALVQNDATHEILQAAQIDVLSKR